MQDLKRQSNRRPAVRKLRTSSMSVRKNSSYPIPGLSVKLRKPRVDPGFSNSWLPHYFVEIEPALLRQKIRWLIQAFFGTCGFVFILWLAGGSVWVGQGFFQQPLQKVLIKGNQLLNDAEVLNTSGLRPGQRLIDLKPYQLAARLQKHPIVQKADIRRKFPDEIHLFLSEYQPVALLKISQQTNVFVPGSLPKTQFVLIGENQLLLKHLSVDYLRKSPHKSLPLIKGLTVSSVMPGTYLNSPVLERGLRFLETFQEMATVQEGKLPKTINELEGQFSIVDWPSLPIHIDISDPLNLKINWPVKYSEHKLGTPEPLRTVPLTIQIGSRNFGERLRTFQNIYPILDKQHPGLKSIDLRYKNRVMLIP